MISDFRGEYAFLSNFADSPLYYKGLRFANAEAAFQAQKATDRQTKESFCSMRAIVAKKTGKKIHQMNPSHYDMKELLDVQEYLNKVR